MQPFRELLKHILELLCMHGHAMRSALHVRELAFHDNHLLQELVAARGVA